MSAKTKLKAQMAVFQKRVRAATVQQRRQVGVLRTQAADSALHWVMAHEGRIKAFRTAVKGTQVQRAMDRLMTMLRTEAHQPKRRTLRRRTRRARM